MTKNLCLCAIAFLLIVFQGCRFAEDHAAGSQPGATEENRFVRHVLAEGLSEPMELAVTPAGNIFWIERKGYVYYYDATIQLPVQVGQVKAFYGNNDGLLGIALDPAYDSNKYVYLFYSPEGDVSQQRLSRFVFNESDKKLYSEKIILTVPTQRQECCHSGGSLAFGVDRLLYIGTGDNVSPKEQDGYTPLDERPGRSAFDSQGSSANSNDLRGKVLRIRVETDGSYTIPEGNLFKAGQPGTRPEIYVMGARNPIRLSIDKKTGYLYFGDIGPDANVASARGPEAFDEINVAKKAGNYGWPYFVGENKAYPDYDFSTGTTGAFNNPKAPVNNSPNNSGIKVLPPAQPALISYSAPLNEKFPSLGTGGRSAMSGPVFRYNPLRKSTVQFPEYYDNTLFIYDWMRDWIKAVRLDKNGDLKSLEDFMPSTKFSSPMDMEFGSDGSLYVLEYGDGWYSDNADAKLVRITYIKGNRPPLAKLRASVLNGKVPLKVTFTSDGSTDPENNKLKYEWRFLNGAEVPADGPDASFTFQQPGVYKVRLTVTDAQGLSSEESVDITAGNTRPEISLQLKGNSSFFWPGRKLTYNITVKDAEDGSTEKNEIPGKDIPVFLEYSTNADNLSPIITDQQKETKSTGDLSVHPGKALIAQSDCKSCHAPEKNSVGPSYKDIAFRYKNDVTALNRLVAKVIQGGGGVWKRDFVMVSHPSLSRQAATEMVKYILTFSESKPAPRRIATEGTISFIAPNVQQEHGVFYLMASYTDRGHVGMKSLSTDTMHIWRSPRVQAENHFQIKKLKVIGRLEDGDDRYLGETSSGANVLLRDLDLTDVRSVTFRYANVVAGTTAEIRTDSLTGTLIGTVALPETGNWKNWKKAVMQVEPHYGRKNLYIIFKNKEFTKNIVNVDWFEFNSQP